MCLQISKTKASVNSLYWGNLILRRKKMLRWVGEMKRQLFKTPPYICSGQLLFGIKVGQLLFIQKEVSIVSGSVPKASPPPSHPPNLNYANTTEECVFPFGTVHSRLSSQTSTTASRRCRPWTGGVLSRWRAHSAWGVCLGKGAHELLASPLVCGAQAPRPPCQHGGQTVLRLHKTKPT